MKKKNYINKINKYNISLDKLLHYTALLHVVNKQILDASEIVLNAFVLAEQSHPFCYRQSIEPTSIEQAFTLALKMKELFFEE